MKGKIVLIIGIILIFALMLFLNKWQQKMPLSRLKTEYLYGPENLDLFRALENPRFLLNKDHKTLYEQDREFLVYATSHGNFAVPLDVISFHHVIALESKNLVLTYCLLSDSAVAFETKSAQKLVVNGQLYLGNAVLIDPSDKKTKYLQINGQGFETGQQLTYSGTAKKLNYQELAKDQDVEILDPANFVKEPQFYADFLSSRKDAKFGMLSAELFVPESIVKNPLEKGFVMRCGWDSCFLEAKSRWVKFLDFWRFPLIPSYRFAYEAIFRQR